MLARLQKIKTAAVIGYWHLSALELYKYLYYTKI